MIPLSRSQHLLGISIWLQESWALCLGAVPLPTCSMPCLPEAFSAELPVPMAAPASPKDLPSMPGGRPGFSDVLDLTVLCPWPEQY